MSELDLFRDFRGGVVAPSEDARRRASARLTSAIEGQHGRGAPLLRPIRRRPGRAVLAMAAVIGATAAALFVSTPWQSSPRLGFLEEVRAALTPPPGRILHMKWEHIYTSEDPTCTSTARSEVWIDLKPPHTYRAFHPLPSPPYPGLPCLTPGTPVEVGGALDGPPDPLQFVPPNTLVGAWRLYFPVEWVQDPWAEVRKRISEGRAHREGTTQLYGQTLVRVRFDPDPDWLASCPAPGHCPSEPEYGYFDPETLYLVVYDYARDPTLPLIRQRERYLAYEYLPRTDDNLALTDIRAQHPGAIER